MLDNVAIDVVLGLVFIFFLYSLLASIIQEILARWFGLRSRTLLKALRRMLEDEDRTFNFTLVNFFIDLGENVIDYMRPLKNGTFLKAFYDSPTIKFLGENKSNSKPSYLEPSSFSNTIIQLLRGRGFNHSLNQMQAIRANLSHGDLKDFTISQETLNQLTMYWMDANNDIEAFKLILEDWFTETMNRATGWYKKQTQILLFLVGLATAIGFNVDSIAIAKILANNKTARNQLINLAIQRQQSQNSAIKPSDSTKLEQAAQSQKTTRLDSVNDAQLLEMLKDANVDVKTSPQILGLGNKLDPDIKEKYQSNFGVVIIGWLLTALAISLGSPFWFDLLNKIMMLRSAVNEPAENNKRNKQSPPPIQPVG